MHLVLLFQKRPMVPVYFRSMKECRALLINALKTILKCKSRECLQDPILYSPFCGGYRCWSSIHAHFISIAAPQFMLILSVFIAIQLTKFESRAMYLVYGLLNYLALKNYMVQRDDMSCR